MLSTQKLRPPFSSVGKSAGLCRCKFYQLNFEGCSRNSYPLLRSPSLWLLQPSWTPLESRKSGGCARKVSKMDRSGLDRFGKFTFSTRILGLVVSRWNPLKSSGSEMLYRTRFRIAAGQVAHVVCQRCRAYPIKTYQDNICTTVHTVCYTICVCNDCIIVYACMCIYYCIFVCVRDKLYICVIFHNMK